MITNITTGIDPSRIQMGKPAFFTSWKLDGHQYYYFSALRSSVESVKEQLEERARQATQETQPDFPTVEGEGAPQYTFAPAPDQQLTFKF